MGTVSWNGVREWGRGHFLTPSQPWRLHHGKIRCGRGGGSGWKREPVSRIKSYFGNYSCHAKPDDKHSHFLSEFIFTGCKRVHQHWLKKQNKKPWLRRRWCKVIWRQLSSRHILPLITTSDSIPGLPPIHYSNISSHLTDHDVRFHTWFATHTPDHILQSHPNLQCRCSERQWQCCVVCDARFRD